MGPPLRRSGAYVLVKDAKEVARRWVMDEAAGAPGFSGAFFHGSINWLSDDATLPATSDVDVMVVLDGADPPDKLGKFLYRDVLLEVSYLPRDQLPSADAVLGQYNLAGSFHRPNIIADPSGWLTPLQAAVAEDYAKRRWVTTRCEHARDKIIERLQWVSPAARFHEQVITWLFPTGVTTHVLLVAGLQNPTVRRRYEAVHELLAQFGRLDFHETLLQLLGCAELSPARVERHLATLTEVFDATTPVVTTPFFFASDLGAGARPIAIDGTRDLIERGYHREAVFWIVATYSRCLIVLAQDAPAEMQERFRPGYEHLLGDLGITSPADLQHRSAQVLEQLPDVWDVAMAILEANPAIHE